MGLTFASCFAGSCEGDEIFECGDVTENFKKYFGRQLGDVVFRCWLRHNCLIGLFVLGMRGRR